MYYLFGAGTLFIIWEYSNRMLRMVIAMTVMCVLLVRIDALSTFNLIGMFSPFQEVEGMIQEAQYALPEWKQYINF